MDLRGKCEHLPLKKLYYGLFLGLIAIPLFLVFIIALLALNQQFKRQALENIDRAQETVIAELLSDVDVMSMRLSHMLYADNNQVLAYAAAADVENVNLRYENEKKLAQAVNMIFEPVTDVISINFAMYDGREIYVKNKITRPMDEIRQEDWYQAALENRNTIYVGSYDTEEVNDLYMGSRKDTMVLVFALSPSIITDSTSRIEMIMYYQVTAASERIKNYNRDYLAGKNKLGIMQIVDASGQVIYATGDREFPESEYACITSEIPLYDTVWYAKSYIRTSELTADFWETAAWVLGAALLVFFLAGYFSRYFLRSIIRPVEQISDGLKQIEDGNLNVHIAPSGQYEIRTMIHRFNAMGRTLRALINEYEEKVRAARDTPEDYFKEIVVKRSLAPKTADRIQELFREPYVLVELYAPGVSGGEEDAEGLRQLRLGFERNPRFASRCFLAAQTRKSVYIYYRAAEDEYREKLLSLVAELQRIAENEQEIVYAACVGQRNTDSGMMSLMLDELDRMMPFYHLCGRMAVIDLERDEAWLTAVCREAEQYEGLAKALYIADDKNCVLERERLFAQMAEGGLPEAKTKMYAAVFAISRYFDRQNMNFSEVFGTDYNYREKIERMTDIRSLKLWLTNYFAWIIDYSASKLNISETDLIVRAKRYIADNYENAELSLSSVANYVGLNEKYFSNRFTKETGEKFSVYLTELRLQKAKELLKNTSFKIYEIAEMVGYHNAEHFNRMFKKYNGISPLQYRKTM